MPQSPQTYRADALPAVDCVSVSNNGAVALLARSIAGQPGNQNRTFRQLPARFKREFTNFAYSEMDDFDKTGWLADALVGLESAMLRHCKGASPSNDTYQVLGRMVSEAYLHSVESIYDNTMQEHSPIYDQHIQGF